jgi:hypothetical protein
VVGDEADNPWRDRVSKYPFLAQIVEETRRVTVREDDDVRSDRFRIAALVGPAFGDDLG